MTEQDRHDDPPDPAEIARAEHAADEDADVEMEQIAVDDKLEWPCPKCGCSHDVEKALHERWGCYLDTDDRKGRPDSDFCGKCREHTGFEQNEPGEWLSVCCSAPAVEMET